MYDGHCQVGCCSLAIFSPMAVANAARSRLRSVSSTRAVGLALGFCQPACQFTGNWLILLMFSRGQRSYFSKEPLPRWDEQVVFNRIGNRMAVRLPKKCRIHPRPSSPLRCYDLACFYCGVFRQPARHSTIKGRPCPFNLRRLFIRIRTKLLPWRLSRCCRLSEPM